MPSPILDKKLLLTILYPPAQYHDHQSQQRGDAESHAKIGSLGKPAYHGRTNEETEEADARHDGDGDARLDRAQLARYAVADRHRRRNAETHQEKAQSGCNKVRQQRGEKQSAQNQQSANLQHSGGAIARHETIGQETSQGHGTHACHITCTDENGSPDIFRGKNFLILQKIYTFVP